MKGNVGGFEHSPEADIHLTKRGELVRWKSEVIVADTTLRVATKITAKGS